MTDAGPGAAFFALHSELPREGPGEAADVARAASVAGLRPGARICDVGCGPGADLPALLAAAPGAKVTGLDLHPAFVAAAAARAPKARVLRGRLIATEDGLPDPAALGPFELVWCAGAAYFEGLGRCLEAWRGALAPGGAVAVSEPCLFAAHPSPGALAFWEGYEGLTDAAGIAANVAAAGYRTLGAWPLSDAAWEAYFGPMEQRIATLRPGADAALAAVLDEAEAEIAGWRRHRRETGYLMTVAVPA